MNQHSCKYLLDSLSEYIDGDLDQTICAEIDKHMSDCEDCRIVVDSLKMTIYLYKTINSKESLPNDVHERLFHRLNLDEFILDKPD